MSRNDVTGDDIRSKDSTEQYRQGWDRIFNKPVVEESVSETQSDTTDNDKVQQ